LISTSIRPEANLIIADEPTPGLHPEALEGNQKIQIKELANQGKGVIMITHDIHSALDIADKIAVFLCR
jgi:ABC-type dipeptide/oligopeptide/nickel transport system, ATPase component